MGELISLQSDHREPSTEPLANLVGMEGALPLKKLTTMLCGIALTLSIGAGSALAVTPLEEKVDELLGVKYVYGGTTKEGFDCSGFTSYVFEQFDIKLSRSSKDQSKDGEQIKKEDLRPGDLVFFETGGAGISHVGIYLGDGEFVHAATTFKGKQGKVMKNKLSETYYAQNYVTAARILDDETYKKIAVELVEKASEEAEAAAAQGTE